VPAKPCLRAGSGTASWLPAGAPGLPLSRVGVSAEVVEVKLPEPKAAALRHPPETHLPLPRANHG